MISISVVNMIPNNWSDEQNQDCEPGLSVNPSNRNEMAATAFTFDNPAGSSAMNPQMTGAWAPIFYSTDGGSTWSLQNILESGAGATLPTFDVTVRFSGNGQNLYSGLISAASNSILIDRAPNPTTHMQNLVTRSGDQPFVEAATTGGQDRVFVGYNGSSTHATVDQSQDATASPPAGFTAVSVDARNDSDGPKTRAAIHPDGTIYVAFYSANTDGTWDVVVVKDTNWGNSSPRYQALIDSGDHKAGVVVAGSISVAASGSEDADFGHDRRGWELAIVVDPNNDQLVYVVHSQGTSAANYTLHLRRSTDGGQTWLADSRTIVKAKNPGLAINALGHVGFVYQQVVGATGSSNWVTVFERSTNDFTTFDSFTVANVPSSTPTPASDMATYIGDYIRLEAWGRDFFGIFSANNTPDLANFPFGVTYQRNVNTTTKTLLGNDNATPVAVSIDPFFFSAVIQDLVVTTDRNTFGKDEIEAMLHLANPTPPNTNPAVITAAFYVVVDGFRASDLNITAATLIGPPNVFPAINFTPGLGAVTAVATTCSAEGNTIVAGRQRFTWTYDLHFTDTSDFVQEVEQFTLTASITSNAGTAVSGQAVIILTTQPNPYEIDGPTSWLSVDLQVFNILQGGSLPGTPAVTLNAGPNDFIHRLLVAYNDPTLPRAPNHPYDTDLVAHEDTSTVEISQLGANMVPVYNFAVARVRCRALVNPAPNVRAFFRLFQAATTSTAFDPTTTYLTGGQAGTKIPLLGVVNGEAVTIPCFAAARISDPRTQSMNSQTDPDNVGPLGASIPPDATGAEVQVYFGCWLDINQTTQVVPINPSSASGPWPVPEQLQSIQTAIVRGGHQCLVAEINLDPPEPQINTGATPAVSDKLAQRNLVIVGTASPHQVPHTFDIKPTPVTTIPDQVPDELMIEWGGVPRGTPASIYLPGVSAAKILSMADGLYDRNELHKTDAHTIICKGNGISYLPIPPGLGSNYAGLITIDLPEAIKRHETYHVVIRQITNAVAPRPRGQPTPEIAAAVVEQYIRWRRILGTFQISIPSSTRALLLDREERLLSVLRWIAEHMPHHNRWYPVFRRYLEVVGGRVGGLGGDPGKILPSPTGYGGREPKPHHPPHRPGEHRAAATGKVCALIFDRFGDFEGFMLDTEDGERRFDSRERDIKELADRAWRERLLITVWSEHHAPHRAEKIVVREPPVPF